MEKPLKAQPCLIATVLICLYLHAGFIKAGSISVRQSAISCYEVFTSYVEKLISNET